jgi:hypothetical protein
LRVASLCPMADPLGHTPTITHIEGTLIIPAITTN